MENVEIKNGRFLRLRRNNIRVKMNVKKGDKFPFNILNF